MCCKIEKYYVFSCIVLSCVIDYTITYIKYLIYIHSREAALTKTFTVKLCFNLKSNLNLTYSEFSIFYLFCGKDNVQ